MLSAFCKSLQTSGRLYSCSYSLILNYPNLLSKYCPHRRFSNVTSEEELKIVNIINKSSEADLEKYGIKGVEIRKILAYKKKHGEFTTFNDILINQNTLTVKKFYQVINSDQKPRRLTKSPRTTKKLTTPAIDKTSSNNIKSILSLDIWNNKVSWAVIDENRNLCHWNCAVIETPLPSSSNPLPFIDAIIDVASKLPHADAYIMESDKYLGLSKLKPAGFLAHLYRRQIITTILATLKMKNQFNSAEIAPPLNIYFLSYGTFSKRFNLSIGSEIVSADSIVDDILELLPLSSNKSSLLNSIDPELKAQYYSGDLESRQLLQRVLLIALTFVDLVKKI